MCNKMLRKSRLGFIVFAMISSLVWGETGAENVFMVSEMAKAAEIDELGLEELSASEDDIKYMVDNTEKDDDKNNQNNSEENLNEEIVTIKGSRFVTDTFNGVKALYRTGGNDGTNATYSCAAYVKRYYSEVYNVSVCNLLAGCTPVSSKGTIRKVSSPKEGDIVATASGSGNHWAIVKHVNNDGTITLIEQNWKWQQDGKTVARVNRKVKANACKIYRLKK